MSKTDWKFALVFGVYFVVWGSYDLVRHTNVAFGAVAVALGVISLGRSLRTWRARRSLGSFDR